MPVGFHTSIQGGISRAIDRAVGFGCDTVQIFLKNPRTWQKTPISRKEIESFKKKRKDAGIEPVSAHASYLVNLSSPSDDMFRRSVDLFMYEIDLAGCIGVDYLVVHLGSPGTKGKDFAFGRILEALKGVRRCAEEAGIEILLENTAGEGFTFGSDLSDMGRLLEAIDGTMKVGFCFDTCHGFGAGYPMRTAGEVEGLVRTIKRYIGLKRLKLIHLNDSKGDLSSHIDRHEHIGCGKIGYRGMRAILNHPLLRDLPFILETPGMGGGYDIRNIRVVRRLMGEKRDSSCSSFFQSPASKRETA